MRYIDADKLYESMQWNIQHDMYDKPFDYLAEIDSQPTADVRENVRGKWVNNIHDIPICNQCGYMTPYDMLLDDYEYGNFCPNCGAQMRGEQDDER